MTTEEAHNGQRKALIIGAGIGGLAAAIALRDAGLDIEVYERASELKEIGAGLTMWRNGIEALGILGVRTRVLEAGSSSHRAEFRTADGRLLRAQDLSALSAEADRPALVVLLRADLQRILLDRLGEGSIHLGHACAGFDDGGPGVTARFTNGTEAHGDLLVGADGIHSAVRAGLHGPEEPRYTGIGVWRAIVRFDHSRFSATTFSQALGLGQRFFWGACGDGQVYWGATKVMPEAGSTGATKGKALLQELYSDWSEPTLALVEATPPEDIHWTATYSGEPLERWGRGVVTLLGDAAHLAAPFLGQGACQALEDAVWLGRYLEKPLEVPAALRGFEAHRQERTTMIMRTSARMGRLLHLRNPLSAAVRNWAFERGPDRIGMRPLKRATTAGL